MSSTGSPFPHTEQLLRDGDIHIADLEGRPTIAIDEGLGIVRALYEDTPESYHSFALVEHWMRPIPELRTQIAELPIWPAVSLERINGREAGRWLGHKAVHQMAVSQGLADFSAWLRENDWMPSPENGNRTHPYCGIDSGRVIYDLEGTGENTAVPTWEGVIADYGAEDPVVQGYFAELKEKVRLDLGELLGFHTDHVRIATAIAPQRKVGLNNLSQLLDEFLLGQGYLPDHSRVEVLEVKPSLPYGSQN